MKRRIVLVFTGAALLAWAMSTTIVTAQSLNPSLPIPFVTALSKDTSMSWKTECVGRVLINMPIDRARSWSAQIDTATVRRLQRPLSSGQFWSGVEYVRDQYIRQKHDLQDTRLAHYERMDTRKAAFVIGYPTDASFWGAWMWRFLHLDDQHAYEFKTEAIGTRGATPSPALFKPYIDEALPVLSRITPLKDGEIPSSEGLCIDGAVVSGDTGKNAVAALNVEIATGTYLGASYLENNHKVALESVFEELKRDQDRAEVGLTLSKEPQGYKEFKVLRRQERALAGLQGQEFITRTTFNNGYSRYTFRWGIKGGAGLLEPTLSVHMDTPGSPANAKGKPYTTLPPEPELISLWDAVLATFRLRPGALSAGQVLRAVN